MLLVNIISSTYDFTIIMDMNFKSKFSNFIYLANLVHMLKVSMDMVFKSEFSNVTCKDNLQ